MARIDLAFTGRVNDTESNRDGSGPGQFPSTIWSQIQVGDGPRGAEAEALDALARRYWSPIRRWLMSALGKGDDEASDLAQEFFAWVIESGFVRKADPARGRFRAFIKTALRHFVASDARRGRAAKRGGGRAPVPLGGDPQGEGPGIDIIAPDAEPDAALDREWRAALVRTALARVEAELESGGRGAIWAVFRAYFLDRSGEPDYATLASDHGITTVDVSNYLARAKKLYRSHLRALVLETVACPSELDEEIAWLLASGRKP